MPLSEHEQRLLDEMERSLYHSEADDVTQVTGLRARPSAAAIGLAIIAAIVGIALLIAGVASRIPLIGVVGFAVLFAGAMIVIAPPRRLRAGSSSLPTGFRDR